MAPQGLKMEFWSSENWAYNEQSVRNPFIQGERGGSVVECRTPEREVRGSKPTAAVLCPWARHFTPRKYWLITQETMAPSRHDWKLLAGTLSLNTTNQPFIQPSVCKYVLFVCFFVSARLQVSFIPLRFRYFGKRFSFCTVDLSRESRVMSPPV